MFFNSFTFAFFFLIVYFLYLVLPHKLQNRMLLVASYVFYGWWDWRFLSLIAISTIIDYYCGLRIHAEEKKKKQKFFVLLSVFFNLGILAFFKYFNFFISSLSEALQVFGWELNTTTLNIVLPVGISFYTFQTMSYSIDIYRKELKPTRDFLDFALYVSFFPQLVAGPIERAKHLLPQILKPRKLTRDDFCTGCYLIFFGLYLKVFIADNLASLVEPVFSSYGPYNGVQVMLGLYAFAFQIFCDFAGYSSIARGLSKCMGFDLMVNFNLPYFSKNPSEFWSRWHISLSSWLRDYLYIPLGGNRNGSVMTYRNLFVTMVLGGLWHGAAWTFIAWGVYQGGLLIVHRLAKPILARFQFPENSLREKIWSLFCIVLFFQFVCIGWLFFRAHSLSQAFEMLTAIFSIRLGPGNGIVYYMSVMLPPFLFFTALLLFVQVLCYRRSDLLVVLKWPVFFRAFFIVVLFYSMVCFGVKGGSDFIYFQF